MLHCHLKPTANFSKCPVVAWIWIELCFLYVVSYYSALFVAGGDDFLSFALHHHYRCNHHFILWHTFLGLFSYFSLLCFCFPSLNCLIRLSSVPLGYIGNNSNRTQYSINSLTHSTQHQVIHLCLYEVIGQSTREIRDRVEEKITQLLGR